MSHKNLTHISSFFLFLFTLENACILNFEKKFVHHRHCVVGTYIGNNNNNNNNKKKAEVKYLAISLWEYIKWFIC